MFVVVLLMWPKKGFVRSGASFHPHLITRVSPLLDVVVFTLSPAVYVVLSSANGGCNIH